MSDGPPEIIAVEHDDYHARHVGWTADGRQFFLTRPFEPAINGRAGGEFIALYIFDTGGNLIEAKIDELGPRVTMDNDKARESYDRRLKELGEVRFGRIMVAPFSVQRFATQIGLVLRAQEEDGDRWAVEAQPGNYMAFFEPWDGGEHDT